MTLPVAMFLMEFAEEQAAKGIKNIDDHITMTRKIFRQNSREVSNHHTMMNTTCPIASGPDQKVHLRKLDNVKSFSPKLDPLLIPNLKFDQNKVAKLNLPPASNQMLKSRRSPPLLNDKPYQSLPDNSKYDSKTIMTNGNTSDAAEKQPRSQAAFVTPKWRLRKPEIRKKLKKTPFFGSQLHDIAFVSQTLGQYFKFKQMVKSLTSMKQPRKITKRNKLAEKLPQKIKEIKSSTDVQSLYPSPELYTTDIWLQIQETNIKLKSIIERTLESLPPFDFFHDELFAEELTVHRTLYASKLFIRDVKISVGNSEDPSKLKVPPVLTCDILEKALTSKLSANAVPFNYDPKKRMENGNEAKPKVSLISFMDFLCALNENMTQSSARSLSYSNFLNSLKEQTPQDSAEARGQEEKKHDEEPMDELQGEKLTPEEEERSKNAVGRSAIGSELPKPGNAEGAAAAVPPLPPRDEVWYGGRDILDLGTNIMGGWDYRAIWQVGPDVAAAPNPNHHSGHPEWRSI